MSLPIAWVLKGKKILLVGGGDVAETRVKKLVDEGCDLFVISPKLTGYIQDRADEGKLNWLKREYQDGDLDLEHWSFVLTAIDNHDVSKSIANECRSKRIPVNVADVIPLCDFYFGANFQQGQLKVMVSTGSGAPRLAKRIRDELEVHASHFKYMEAIDNVSKMRALIRTMLPDNHPKVSKVRMALMSSVCDHMSFLELAQLKEEELSPMVRGMFLSVGACPEKPIGNLDLASDFVETNTTSSREEKKKKKKKRKATEMEVVATEVNHKYPKPEIPPFPFPKSQ